MINTRPDSLPKTRGRGVRRAQCGTVTRATGKSAKDVKKGFRWDPAYSRWIQDDRMEGFDAPVVIQPKSGAAYTIWPAMWSDLMDFKLDSIEPEEAEKLQKAGWTLLDVRVADNYNHQHILGSINIPLYRYVQGKSMFDNAKRLAMAAFAMKATERDPDFAKNVEKQLGKNAKIVMVCDIGGTLSTKVEVAHKVKTYEVKDPERAFGRESRSLKATHALIQAGFKNIKHLKGGLQQWRYQGYPVE